jgi:hypothetical protein
VKAAFHWIGLVLSVSSFTVTGILGCASVAGSKPQSLVRVIDASSNAPAVNVYVGNTSIAGNLASPAFTSYAYISPATLAVDVDPVGTSKATAQTSGTFLDGQQHSVFITDLSSFYRATVLTDQNIAAPSGQISVRFLHCAPLNGDVDIYFVPYGYTISDVNAVLTDLAAGTTTAYINIAAGTYTVVVVPTGTATALYTSNSTVFTGGQVRTMLIVDQELLVNTPISVIIGNDLN